MFGNLLRQIKCFWHWNTTQPQLFPVSGLYFISLDNNNNKQLLLLLWLWCSRMPADINFLFFMSNQFDCSIHTQYTFLHMIFSPWIDGPLLIKRDLDTFQVLCSQEGTQASCCQGLHEFGPCTSCDWCQMALYLSYDFMCASHLCVWIAYVCVCVWSLNCCPWVFEGPDRRSSLNMTL